MRIRVTKPSDILKKLDVLKKHKILPLLALAVLLQGTPVKLYFTTVNERVFEYQKRIIEVVLLVQRGKQVVGSVQACS